MLDHFLPDKPEDYIITADRGYESYDMIFHCVLRGFYYCFRVKSPDSPKSLLSTYKDELTVSQDEFDVMIKRFFTDKYTNIMKEQSDVYHYMNPSKNIPHFSELLKRNRSFIERYQNDRLNIYSSDLVKSPVLYGFDIYIPTGMVDEKRNYALAVMHERCHFQQWDELWNLMRVISSCIYWFNPFVWLAVVRSRDDSEYSCDEAVIKNMDEHQKKDYCRLLIEVATGGKIDNNSFLEAGLTRSPIFKRIERMLTEKKRMIWLKTIIFLCLIMVMVLTLNTAG